MSKRIFRSIFIVSLAVLIASISTVLFVLYQHLISEQFEELRNETRLVEKGIELNGMDYLQDLDTAGFRITWISKEGDILFDNVSMNAEMENHLEREEIREAVESGRGESIRYSSTLSERQLYSAVLLEEGSILRLSITTVSVWTMFFHALLPMLILFAAASLISFCLASRLSRRIVEPLNAIDLDHPLEEEEVYSEIRPLLQRLEDQHDQIRSDQEKLEKAARIRQEFTANVSHELKSPLHVISGYAELLENGMVEDEDVGVFAGKIRTESQRMSKLVEDIIELGKLDKEEVPDELERVDLYEVAKDVCAHLETSAEDAKVSLELQGDRAFIYGVPHVLYSMVFNLCTNAIKYNREGGHVDIAVREEENTVTLTVTDDGIGIPEEDLGRIFERFYRVDKSRSKSVGGTGLGLSIVKHGAQIHKAEISVESEVGKGSVFTLSFPV